MEIMAANEKREEHKWEGRERTGLECRKNIKSKVGVINSGSLELPKFVLRKIFIPINGYSEFDEVSGFTYVSTKRARVIDYAWPLCPNLSS